VPPRRGVTHALDIERPADLTAYLEERGHLGGGERPEIRVLTGGVSNRVVLVERSPGPSWVIKQALAKLRVEADWFSDPARIHSEAAGLRALRDLAPPGSVPAFVFEDREHHLLCMEAVPEPHENWKQALLSGRVDRGAILQLAELLATIHRRSSGRSDLATQFEDRTHFESLRLEPYYGYAARQVPDAAPFLQRLAADTRARRLAIVHGDYSPKNVLVREGRLVLLDCEVIHFGDPAFDLGFSLAHLLGKAHHLEHHREVFAEAALRYWDTYAGHLGGVSWGESLEVHAVRHALGCLLARAAGRSPLEYLSEAERRHQVRVVVSLLAEAPVTMRALFESFVGKL
jgi:aminoglycoside phosphotransferase (APT) family kinase protein